MFIRNGMIFLVLLAVCSSCQSDVHQASEFAHTSTLYQIRLGDGIPLNLDFSLRWSLAEWERMERIYHTPDSFYRTVVVPRMYEYANSVAFTYPSVDSVFGPQRMQFTEELRAGLATYLAQKGMEAREVLLTQIRFPQSYTKSMEQAGLQKQLLQQIKVQHVVDLEKAEADKQKTIALSQVAIAQAEAEAKVQRIEAQTEKSRRQSELAKAETQAQVAQIQAKSEADRLRKLAQASLAEKEELMALDVKKQERLDHLAAEKQRAMDRVEFEKQLELADVIKKDPNFGAFLVHRELAKKVEIAVLPTGTDPAVFGGLLEQKMK